MEIHEIDVYFSKERSFDIHFGADFQIGSMSCDKQRITRWVNRVTADPFSIWGFLGDVTDDDRPTTRISKVRANADREEVNIASARDHMAWLDKEVMPLLLPLKQNRSLGGLAGHHWMQLSPALNSAQLVFRELGCKYLGEMSAWVWVNFIGKRDCKGINMRRLFHIQHGVGGGGATGGSLRKLDTTSQGFQADVLVRAHDCKLEAAKKDELYPSTAEERRIYARTKCLLNIGSATRGYELGQTSYPEHAMMRPVSLGWGVIKAEIRKAEPWEASENGWTVEFFITI